MNAKLLVATFVIAQVASATVAFDLSPVAQPTPPGGITNPACSNATLRCLIFSGTIAPDPTVDVFVNAISISFAPPTPLLLNIDAFFFSNVPGLFLSNDTPYVGPVFALEVDPGVAPGIYTGSATLLGGAGPAELIPLVSASFQVQVVAEVPEPSTWFIGIGIAVAAIRSRMKS
jgi:hypothetical protein